MNDSRPRNCATGQSRWQRVLVAGIALMSLLGGGVSVAHAQTSGSPKPATTGGSVRQSAPSTVKKRMVKRRRHCPKGTHRSKAHRPKNSKRHPCIRNTKRVNRNKAIGKPKPTVTPGKYSGN